MVTHNGKLLKMISLLFLLLTTVQPCAAEKITVDAAGQYLISKNENMNDGEAYAYKEALRSAIEKVAVRVVSYTKTVNQVLEEDIVETFASSVVKVLKKEVHPVVEGDNVIIKVMISAVVNTDDIMKWQPPDLKKQKQLEQDNKELKEQILREKKERLISAVGRQGGSSDELAMIAINRIQPLIREQRYVEADKILTDTIKGGIEHPELYYQRGWLAMKTRQFGAAEADFQKACKLSQDSRYLKSRGDSYFMVGKYELAMIDYQRVISTNPGDATAIANMGACYWALGSIDYAIECYDRAVDLGLEMAKRIRYNLNGQFTQNNKHRLMKPTARKVLPLC